MVEILTIMALEFVDHANCYISSLVGALKNSTVDAFVYHVQAK